MTRSASPGFSIPPSHENALLHAADDAYLIMRQGDAIELAFSGYDQLDDVVEVWVVAEGYCEPLHEIDAH